MEIIVSGTEGYYGVYFVGTLEELRERFSYADIDQRGNSYSVQWGHFRTEEAANAEAEIAKDGGRVIDLGFHYKTWCPTAHWNGKTYVCNCALPLKCYGARAAMGLSDVHGEAYIDFGLCVLNEEQHKRTCNYWYTVSTGATSHTAFRTKEGLLQWINERGLQLTAELTEPGTWSYQRLLGKYHRVEHLNPAEFYSLSPKSVVCMTRVMSNGDYTLGIITEAENGERIVHSLNPNVKTRPVFAYFHP